MIVLRRMKQVRFTRRDAEQALELATKNFLRLFKASENLEIEPTIIDMWAYVPRKLLPFAVMLEEYM